jgi:acid-sensing ion channel, other
MKRLLHFYYISRRNCYFENERKLKFFNKYSMQNCIHECLSNASLEICNCVQYFQIRDQKSTLCFGIDDIVCFEKVLSVINDVTSDAFKFCDCLPSCNHIDYKFDVILQKLKESSVERNVTSSSLSIYFASDEFVVLKRHESFGAVTLVSNIGGLLGLFLGVSILSVVEIFYYFVIRFINNLWWSESI